MARVLVWCDEPLLRAILEEVLANEGWAAQLCPTLADLEAQADDGDVAVVDGVGTVRALDGEARTFVEQLARRLPVVLLSGWKWATAELGQQLGVAAVINKPFELDVLLTAVEQAAAGTSRLDVEWTTSSAAEVRVTLFRNLQEHERQTYPHVRAAEPTHAIFKGLPTDGVYIVQIEQPDGCKLLDVPRWPPAATG